MTLIAENLGEITAHPDKGKQISANCIVHEKQITVLNILEREILENDSFLREMKICVLVGTGDRR